MAEEIEFVNGMIVKPPHPNAPDFVKAGISLKVSDFAVWLSSKVGEDWINIDIKESKGGKWYAVVSTFKPKDQPRQETKPGSNVPAAEYQDDAPF
jgi:hypothetical protein